MVKTNNKMNNRAIRLLVAFLLLSQWFSLAHATDHILTGDEPECHICQLNSENGQAKIIEHAQDLIPLFLVYDLPHYLIQYHTFDRFVRTIRGPPQLL